MGMTEKQGGSDVRANTTRAVAAAGRHLPADRAQVVHLGADERPVPGAGPARRGRLLLPRPPGAARRQRATCSALQRLKDKLGDRSNASSEVEFDGTTGWLVGEPGRGVPAIIEMVNTTRLDCVLGSAATVRAALTQAIHHARHRRAFGALLVDQPLMQNVLADLAVESEAATALGDPAGRGAGRGGVGVPAAGRRGGEVLGLQAHAGRRRRGDGGASAATATSRSPGCRGSTGRRR